MNIKELLADWGINAIALVAAMIGGLLHVVMDENQFSYKSACAQILSATAFGGYGTEWLIKWLGWEEVVGDKTSIVRLTSSDFATEWELNFDPVHTPCFSISGTAKGAFTIPAGAIVILDKL